MVFENGLLSTLMLLLIKSYDRKNASKFKYRKQMKHFFPIFYVVEYLKDLMTDKVVVYLNCYSILNGNCSLLLELLLSLVNANRS